MGDVKAPQKTRFPQLWPHIFAPGEPKLYSDLTLAEFCSGYIATLQQHPGNQEALLSHFHDPMILVSSYKWSAVRSFHYKVLRSIELGLVKWGGGGLLRALQANLLITNRFITSASTLSHHRETATEATNFLFFNSSRRHMRRVVLVRGLHQYRLFQATHLRSLQTLGPSRCQLPYAKVPSPHEANRPSLTRLATGSSIFFFHPRDALQHHQSPTWSTTCPFPTHLTADHHAYQASVHFWSQRLHFAASCSFSSQHFRVAHASPSLPRSQPLRFSSIWLASQLFSFYSPHFLPAQPRLRPFSS